MAYQNRVDPCGQIVATAARGTLMGNRGCLHDQGEQPIRQYQSRRWIICVLDFKGRTRRPMPPGHYTSLFFLDEASALAAGHRPCAECQRERFNLFRSDWFAANAALLGSLPHSVDTIDRILHGERISNERFQRNKTKRTYPEQLDQLPNGSFILLQAAGIPYLVLGDTLRPWHFEGYGQPIARPSALVHILTPRSIVQTLAYGYIPTLHATTNLI